jgi:MFS family permease
MFPQLGAPLGFILSTGVFVLLTAYLSEAQFLAWGWRVPFLASAILVLVGLYVRLRLSETPAFERTLANDERVRVPLATVARKHTRMLVLTTFAAVTTFVIFYLMTVFTLSFGTTQLSFARQDFLLLQIVGVLFFAATIPISALAADRYGRRPVLIAATLGIIVFGFLFAPLFDSGSDFSRDYYANALRAAVFLSLGLGLMGLTYGPLGTALAELFPTAVRYTGASVAFNLAGILGGSLAPYIATWLAANYGIAYVGYYLSAAGVVTLAALVALPAPLRPPSLTRARPLRAAD